jgi:uncharacterized protein (TIGR02246 family)
MKKFISTSPILITMITMASLLFAAGCNTANFDKAAARKELESADSLFVDLLNKGDATGLANCYTTDALLMMPNAPSIKGRSNIQAAMLEFIKSDATKMSVQINNVWGEEDALISEGTMTFSTQAGKLVDQCKYIAVYKKEDGRWKMFRDCYNSDLPLPAVK